MKKLKTEPYPEGTIVALPHKGITKGVIMQQRFIDDWWYHIKYNERIIGEALRADHNFVCHKELSERGTVNVISKTKGKYSTCEN